MKNDRNNSLLMNSIRVLTRDYKMFYISFFGIMTVLYVIEFVVARFSDTVRIGGIEHVFAIACFVSGLTSFKENYFFFAQNQVPKRTIAKAFVIEGIFFGLVSALLVNIYFHIIEWVSSLQSLNLPGFLALIPNVEGEGISIGFFGRLMLVFCLYTATYFSGLSLATINYRLNWLGRVIFWVPFGIIALNAFIGTLEYILDAVPMEELDIPSPLLAKPFIRCVEWITQSVGHFAVGSVALTAVYLIVGVLVFRGAEIKYKRS